MRMMRWVVEQIVAACQRARAAGLRVMAGRWGVELVDGVYRASDDCVCPLGALLLGTAAAPSRAWLEDREDMASAILGVSLEVVADMIAEIDAIGRRTAPLDIHDSDIHAAVCHAFRRVKKGEGK